MNKEPKIESDDTPWELTPLTPKFCQNEHGPYVEAISRALDDKSIRNIALSGNYGVGKSSILQKVADDLPNQVVELSLSTLAPIKGSNLDDSIPKQATTSTNRIQQEIVKQLLYSEKPSKTSGSRFQRIERFNFFRELSLTSFLGLIVTITFLLTGWTENIEETLLTAEPIGVWAHVIFFAISSSSFFLMRCLFHGRIHIKQLSAGTATVTLDKKSVSFFDQYLDEIVYFFEVSERDIVIFEDLDRFEDPLIFETLRALNTLLNNAPQIKKNIRFIYAIKDSIFDQATLLEKGRSISKNHAEITDPAQSEVVRANRTKFFDLVIPVVPFITHRNAKSLTKRIFGEIENSIKPELMDLASRHIPDMRLLKNAKNEFIVFRNRIFSGEGKHLDLNETELLAMMLYKSTHLTDFEDVYIGRSKLDQIYSLSRELVATNVQEIEKRLRRTQSILDELSGIKEKSILFTRKLFAHIDRIARIAGLNSTTLHFTFDGLEIQKKDIDEDFWERLSKAESSNTLTWVNNQRRHLNFKKQDLEDALDSSLSAEYWDAAYRSELENRINDFRESLKFLRAADMGKLIKRSEFLTSYLSSTKSLDEIAKHLFQDGLAYHLLREGYINRNFTLYTSTFHGDRTSPVATNFIIHHVEKNSMDEYFQLDADDVEAVIRECGTKALSETVLYNIAIIDHLLKTRLYLAGIMIKALAKLGSDEQRFIQAYLLSGNEVTKFVERFVKVSSKALLHFVEEVELDDSSRLAIIDAALGNLSGSLRYMTSPELSKYLKANYTVLDVLTKKTPNDGSPARIAKLFSDAGIVVHDLSPLSKPIREAFIAQNLYEITFENLTIALGYNAELALDEIENKNIVIFNYVFDNLQKYFSSVLGHSVAIKHCENFSELVQKCYETAQDSLELLIRNSNEDCIAFDIDELSEDVWPLLVSEHRIKASFNNIWHYLALQGELDVHMANFLSEERAVLESENIDESNKRSLALTIINNPERIQSSDIRAQLVVSLDIESYLDVDDIFVENSDLFSVLLAQDIIEDAAESYAKLKEVGWTARELFIVNSSRFSEYVSPELLSGDIGKFLRSDNVSHELKLLLVEQADDYLRECYEEDRKQLAVFAAQNSCQLSLRALSEVAGDAGSVHYILKLLTPHLKGILREELFDILEQLGEPYERLTRVGKDKPKVLNTKDNIELLETLKSLDIVNSYKPIQKSYIRVNKKQK